MNTTWGAAYLLQRVEQGTYGRVDIFQGHIDDHKGHHPFLTLREENPDRMNSRVRQFVEDSGGAYTVYLRPYHNAPWNMAEKLFIDVQKQLAPIQGDTRAIDVEAVINTRIATKMAEIERQREIEDLRAENERLKNPVERLALLAEIVVSKYVKHEPTPATVQGSSNVNPDKFQNAVNGLTQKFTAAGLIRLNERLDEQPHMIKLVKDYANL
jgi:hypothetical protein